MNYEEQRDETQNISEEVRFVEFLREKCPLRLPALRLIEVDKRNTYLRQRASNVDPATNLAFTMQCADAAHIPPFPTQ
jgi:hypothetical protein